MKPSELWASGSFSSISSAFAVAALAFVKASSGASEARSYENPDEE